MKITSRQNQRIKDAAKLRERRHRQREQRFLIEGVRELSRAIQAGVPIVEAFISSDFADSREDDPLLTALRQQSVPIHNVATDVFEKLAYGDRSEGVIAVAQVVPRVLKSLELPPQPVVAILEGVEKPGNLGAICRTADAAGVAALVVVGQGTDIHNPNAIRASLGTLFCVPFVETDAGTALAWVKGLNLPILAARPDAKTLYTDADYSAGAAIVLGSEAEGLSDTWRDPAVIPIRLPMHGIADSLNVSTAAAVLFYEARRHRPWHRGDSLPLVAE
jgi:RNA methyltransferase, TrmH family